MNRPNTNKGFYARALLLLLPLSLDQFNPYLCCGRLSSQGQVDGYACVEEGRLTFIADQQRELRCEHMQGITDAVAKGSLDGAKVGKQI